MTKYYAVNGQTLTDVCLNTYGSLDYYYKLLQDNNIDGANQIPATNQLFLWDETVVVDFQINRTTTLGNIRYATAMSNNGNTYFITTGVTGTPLPLGGGGYTPVIPYSMYQKTSATDYTVTADNVTVINFPALAGKEIIQIEKNIQPLLSTDWVWNKALATLTLTDALYNEEKLFIIYTEIITA